MRVRRVGFAGVGRRQGSHWIFGGGVVLCLGGSQGEEVKGILQKTMIWLQCLFASPLHSHLLLICWFLVRRLTCPCFAFSSEQLFLNAETDTVAFERTYHDNELSFDLQGIQKPPSIQKGKKQNFVDFPSLETVP